MHINLRHASYIVSLWKHKTFSKAAEALRISQPALSRSVANFEAACGSALFDRTAHGVVPTEFGKPILLELEALLLQANRIGDRIGSRAEGKAGAIAFGVGPMFAGILREVIVRIVSDRPGVEAEVEIDSADSLVSMLNSEKIEFCVFSKGLVPARNKDLKVTPIGAVPLGIIGRLTHPLVGLGSVSLSDVNKFVVASGSRPKEDLYLPAGSPIMPDIKIRSDNFLMLESCVRSSDLLLFSSPALISAWATGEFCNIPVFGFENVVTEICCVSLVRKSLSPLGCAVIELIQRQIAQCEYGE